MAGQKTVTSTNTTKGLYYIVSGTPDPDCKGEYFPDAIVNGVLSYKRSTGTFYLWWNLTNFWCINTVPGVDPGSDYWSSRFAAITSNYLAAADYTGVPVVTQGMD